MTRGTSTRRGVAGVVTRGRVSVVTIWICEAARVEELAPEMLAAGLSPDAQIFAVGSIPPGSDAEWVGLPPGPDGGTFDLHAPIEGADDEPRWVEYSVHTLSSRWNYTRDLVALFSKEKATQ
jgi:hypothetical protein